VLMPVMTDLNKQPAVLAAVFVLLVGMFVKGGATGRSAALVLIVTIAFSDQFSSSWVKHLFERARPCHVLTDVHLLVSCGSGYAFPSSHAVNNAAGAVVLSFFYRKWTSAFVSFAALVGFSRIYVGVHYPSDVLGGLVLGSGCGFLTLFLYLKGRGWWKSRRENRKDMA
ncbi:MAG: phosphatase PAP2 family protein, partial [Ignavibacteriales bacterium]|nr:phosphatase PAP2 family protein [Ignavibacteriales bacterium]